MKRWRDGELERNRDITKWQTDMKISMKCQAGSVTRSPFSDLALYPRDDPAHLLLLFSIHCHRLTTAPYLEKNPSWDGSFLPDKTVSHDYHPRPWFPDRVNKPISWPPGRMKPVAQQTPAAPTTLRSPIHSPGLLVWFPFSWRYSLDNCLL